jgi:hypothetical protein
MFKRDVPPEVASAGVSKWYSSLDDQNKVRLGRYLKDSDSSSKISFFSSVAELSIKDENFKFAAVIGDTNGVKMSAYEEFMFNELIIDAYIGAERYDDAKRLCNVNLELFPKIESEYRKKNNGLPQKMNCRNRYIDVLVGVEVNYDQAFIELERFFKMGLIDKEDLDFRVQSLKVHRLQRTFDGVYTFRKKEDSQ